MTPPGQAWFPLTSTKFIRTLIALLLDVKASALGEDVGNDARDIEIDRETRVRHDLHVRVGRQSIDIVLPNDHSTHAETYVVGAPHAAPAHDSLAAEDTFDGPIAVRHIAKRKAAEERHPAAPSALDRERQILVDRRERDTHRDVELSIDAVR